MHTNFSNGSRDVLCHIALFITVDDLVDLMLVSRYFNYELHPKRSSHLIPTMLCNEAHKYTIQENQPTMKELRNKWENAACDAWNNTDITPFRDPPLRKENGIQQTSIDNTLRRFEASSYILHFIHKCKYGRSSEKEKEIQTLLNKLVSLDRDNTKYSSYLGLSTMLYSYIGYYLSVNKETNVVNGMNKNGFARFVAYFGLYYRQYHTKDDSIKVPFTVNANFSLFNQFYRKLCKNKRNKS